MPTDSVTTANTSSLKWPLCFVSIGLGAVLALRGDWYAGDTVSYLDMGDRFFAGDHSAIINGLWSPFFPYLQGLARWLLKPSMRWEPAVYQLTNLLIYVSTVISFQFFWGMVQRLYKHPSEAEGPRRCAIFTDAEFWSLGYSLFLLVHLDQVTVGTPDMLLSTSVYLAAGLVLQVQLNGPSLSRFFLLGLVLGLGFLTKAIMLPLAAVFLAAAALGRRRWRLILSYATVSALAFAALAGPYVFALSKKLGHFTAGEAGPLNYAFHVSGMPFTHWQGDGPGKLGSPLHPTRKISASPTIYEYATPVAGTYPPWDDPVYWNEGFHVRFSLADQLGALKRNLLLCLRLMEAQVPLIVGVLVLMAMREPRQSIIKEYLSIWYVWAPALAAFLFYASVWIEDRYVAQFFVMFWAAALTLVRLPEGNYSRRLIRAVSAVVLILMSLQVVRLLVRDAITRHHDSQEQMQIAEGIAEAGIHRGEKVAVVGPETGEGWENLARLLIVAEIAYDEKNQFWASDESKRKQVYGILAKSGAVVLIAPEIPAWANAAGWKQIGQTPVYIYRLGPLHESP